MPWRDRVRRASNAALTSVVGMVFFVVTVATASAGGLRDLGDAWLLPSTELVARLWQSAPSPADRDAPQGAALVAERVAPIGGRSLRRFWCGHAQLHGMPELPIALLGLELPLLGLQWSAQWQRLGRVLLREDQWRLACRRPTGVMPRVKVGWDRLALAGSPTESRLFVSAGVTLRLATGWLLRCEPPLTPPPPWYGPTAARRWLLLTGGSGPVAGACAVERTTAGAPLVQIGLVSRIATRVALGLRAEPVTGTVGLTTAWRYGSWLLRTAHLVHPQLGATHRWYLTAGSAGSGR